MPCRSNMPQLYEVLSDFYLQNPAQWLPDAVISSSKREPEISEENDHANAETLHSEDADELFTFAVTCYNDGRYDLAEKAATRAIDLDPSDAEAYQQRAAVRAKLSKYKPALDDCQRALDLDDSDTEVYRTGRGIYRPGAV